MTKLYVVCPEHGVLSAYSSTVKLEKYTGRKYEDDFWYVTGECHRCYSTCEIQVEEDDYYE